MDLATATLPELTQLCRSLRWIGPTATLAQSEPAGVGNMNHTLRVNVQSPSGDESPSLVLKQSLPFVARFPDIPAPVERSAIEAAFYRSVAREPALSERTPQLRGYHAREHLLCLQDLGVGSDMTHLYDSKSFGDAGQTGLDELTGWLSQLHATPAPADFPDNSAMRRLNHEHIFQVPFNTQSGIALESGMARLRSALAADPPFLTAVVRLGAIYLGQQPFRSEPALLHGDYYPGSWLHNEQAGPMVIDPEFGFVGPAEFDVGVMQAHLTFAGLSAAARAAAMRRYQPGARFDPILVRQFAAIEVLRRLLGVAQLPLQASAAEQLRWAEQASEVLRGCAS